MNEMKRLERVVSGARAQVECMGACASGLAMDLAKIDLSKLTPGVPEAPGGYEIVRGWVPAELDWNTWFYYHAVFGEWYSAKSLGPTGGAFEGIYRAGGLMARPIPTPPPVPYSPQFGDLVQLSGPQGKVTGKYICTSNDDYWIMQIGHDLPSWFCIRVTPILPEPAEPEVKDTAPMHLKVLQGWAEDELDALASEFNMQVLYGMPRITKESVLSECLALRDRANADPRKEKGGNQ